MTNEKFWELADKYEYYDYQKGETPMIYAKNIKDLAREIIEVNGYDYDESKADFDLFDYWNPTKAEKIFGETFEKMQHKKEKEDIKYMKYLLNKENCCSLDKSEMFELQDLINKYGYPEY